MHSEIEVWIPADSCEERKYSIDVLFSDFLGIPYQLMIDDRILDYHIRCGNRELVIRDRFWGIYKGEPLAWLTEAALPKVSFLTNCPYIPEKDIPLLYGEEEFVVSEENIVCGIDIFASSFFMLTRWEEYVNKIRDQHGRFAGEDSIAYKSNFLHRPIVNEYVEMLWNMLKTLGYAGQRKKQKFELVLTHDIDIMKSVNPLRVIAGDIFKRRNLKQALQYIPALFKDPVDTYSFLMKRRDKLGIKSHFYFMAVERQDNDFDSPCYLNSKRFRSSRPFAYFGPDGVVRDYTDESAADPYLKWLVRSYNQAAFRWENIPFYMTTNLKVTKKLFREKVMVAMFITQMFNYMPSYKIDGVRVRRHASPYFGMEVNFRL